MALVRGIFLIGVLGVAALAGAYFAAFSTPPGRAVVKIVVERQLSAMLKRDVSIGVLSGAMPSEIKAQQIAAEDEHGALIVIDELNLNWRPLSLLRQPVKIRLLELHGVFITSASPDNTDKKSGQFKIPGSLPRISIEEIIVDDLRTGNSREDAARLDATGALLLNDGEIGVVLEAHSDGSLDSASVTIRRDARGKESSISANIAGVSGGVISGLLGLEKGINLAALGSGPIDDFNLNLRFVSDEIGALGANAGGDFLNWRSIAISGDFRPGENLAGIASEFGEALTFEMRLAGDENSLEVKDLRLDAAMAGLSGEMAFEIERNNFANFSSNLDVEFSRDWRPDIQPFVGERAAIEISLTPSEKQGLYSAIITLTATKFDIRFHDVVTDLRKDFDGGFDIAAKRNDALPKLLDEGFTAGGRISFTSVGELDISDFDVQTSAGALMQGRGKYNLMSGIFEIDSEVDLPPAAISRIDSDLSAEGSANANIKINGDLKKFSTSIKGTTPEMAFQQMTTPSLVVAFVASDLPRATNGGLRIRSNDGRSKLDVDLRPLSGGGLSLQGIDYSTKDFALKGSLDIEGNYEGARIDLNYEGGPEAQPWPNVKLTGSINANGYISRKSAMNEIALAGDHISAPGVELRDVNVTASGHASSLTVNAKIGSVALTSAPTIIDSETVAFIDLADAANVTLRTFNAIIADQAFQLIKPALISFADGVSVSGVDARYGPKGVINLDGKISRDRWRGKLVARDAPISGISSMLDLTVDLDTDRTEPAHAEFSLQSRLNNLDVEKLSGNVSWDGMTISITDNDASTDADFHVSVSAELARNGGVKVRTFGQLSGDVRLNGRIETFAGFLPSRYQGVDGAFSLNATLAGSVNDPELNGEMKISDASFTELSSGLAVIGVKGDASARATSAGSKIDYSLTGHGPGQDVPSVFIDGDITLGATDQLRAIARFERARFSGGPVTDVVANGEITLAGAFANLRMEGDLMIDRLDAEMIVPETSGLVHVDVVKLNGESSNAVSSLADTARNPVAMSLQINADDKIFIRGRGVESEWKANIVLDGTAAKPIILGSMDLRRGWIDFAGRRFGLSSGSILFDRLSTNNPTLDLKADYEAENVTASILIAGRADSPKISLSSTPSLPADDIMALVLFGKPATELSAFEALQVAQALAQLSGIGPFGGAGGVTGAARSALGLDLLNIDVAADAGASKLTVGKYVADGLFVSASQDARGEDGSIRVEYEVTNSITVETELKQDGDQTVSANWKLDF